MTVFTITEPTTAIRDWLRTLDLTGINAVYAGGLPNPYDLGDDGPAVVLYRVGGAVDPMTGLDSGDYQFDCLAANAALAAQTAGVLMSALMSPVWPIALTDTVRLTGVTITNILPMSDPDPAHNRYLVTAQAVTITDPS